MSAMRTTLPVRAVWIAFGAIWGLILVAHVADGVLMTRRREAFERVYFLGGDVAETHDEISWLAWSHYDWRVDLLEDPPETSPGASKPWMRLFASNAPISDDLAQFIGGVVALEVTTPDGVVVVPKQELVLFRDSETHGVDYYGMSDPRAGAIETQIVPRLLDRWDVHVTTTRSSANPHPCAVRLTCRAVDVNHNEEIDSIVEVVGAMIFVISAILLASILAVAKRVVRRRRPDGESGSTA